MNKTLLLLIMKPLTTLLPIVLLSISQTTTADDFRIVDHQTVEFSNPFCANVKLKITFTRGNITHTDHKLKTNAWTTT